MTDFTQFADAGLIFLVPLFILALWSIAWKGYALWVSAKENKKWWFIIILIVNTFGILEIIFIIFFSETGKKQIADWKSRRTAKNTPSKTQDEEKSETSADTDTESNER